MNLNTELYEAEPRVAKVMENIATTIIKEGGGDMNRSFALGMSVLVQVFLRQNGNVNAGPEIGEMVKQGIITMMDACKDIAKITHNTRGGIN